MFQVSGNQYSATIPASYFDQRPKPNTPLVNVDIAFYSQYPDGSLDLSSIGISEPIRGNVLPQHNYLFDRPVFTMMPEFAWYARKQLNVGRAKRSC